MSIRRWLDAIDVYSTSIASKRHRIDVETFPISHWEGHLKSWGGPSPLRNDDVETMLIRHQCRIFVVLNVAFDSTVVWKSICWRHLWRIDTVSIDVVVFSFLTGSRAPGFLRHSRTYKKKCHRYQFYCSSSSFKWNITQPRNKVIPAEICEMMVHITKLHHSKDSTRSYYPQ